LTSALPHAFELSSVYTQGEAPTYRLMLTNRSAAAVSGFTLGFSGPGRVNPEAPLSNGTMIHQVSNWVEIAAPKDLVLAPGETWTVVIHKLDFPMHHWTDGATTGIVALADGSVHPALTRSSALAHAGTTRKRGVMPLPVPVPAPEPVAIVPWPQQVEVSGARTAPDGLAIIAPHAAGQDAAQSFADLVSHLFPGEGLVRPLEEGGYRVDLALDTGLGAEAYRIAFAGAGARVAASGSTGFLYGLISLGQALRGARLHPESFAFPTGGTIADAPSLAWRGCHLDVARRFYSSGEIAQFLRILAWNKLNRFHWHLSDDEAWRVEIDAYPELTAKGAWRGYGQAIPPLLGSGPERSGGFYTKAAVRALVALGQELGIETVPEIDVPGHCFAMLVAMPQLKDPGENALYNSIQGFPNNCLNPASEAVYPVIETIFEELCGLFPSRYFHVGADEVPSDAWSASPVAKALEETLGAPGAAPLQAHFLQRIQAFLSAKGKITGAWEEAAQGGGIDKSQCYLVGWHTVAASQRLARDGYDVVVSPGQSYYLDMANGPGWEEPGAAWAGWSSPEKTYAFDPSEGWSEAERARLLGVQACIWSEPMTDRAVFDRLVFPRLSAIAETGWTEPSRRSWPRFAAAAGLMPSLYNQKER